MSLDGFIRCAAGAESVKTEEGHLLAGGAIQQNRAMKVVIRGGEFEGTHEMVLRAEAPATIAESRPLTHQFKLLEAAKRAAINAPRPYWCCEDPEITGKPFYLMERVFGEALGVRITRAGAQPDLAAQLGEELARIHDIKQSQDGLEFLEDVQVSPALDAIAKYRSYLDELPEPHPVLEWTLRWLELAASPSPEIVLCHRDFRTGNYMVEGGKLTGILDWEFAGWGDPHEDIAWFCARCWRFSGVELEAGGIAERQIFYQAYEQGSGRRLNPKTIAYWEAMAHVRWAVIALQQSMRHRSGLERSLELGLIGRRVSEIEYECLRLTGAL